jgi:hypothetical protein
MEEIELIDRRRRIHSRDKGVLMQPLGCCVAFNHSDKPWQPLSGHKDIFMSAKGSAQTCKIQRLSQCPVDFEIDRRPRRLRRRHTQLPSSPYQHSDVDKLCPMICANIPHFQRNRGVRKLVCPYHASTFNRPCFPRPELRHLRLIGA